MKGRFISLDQQLRLARLKYESETGPVYGPEQFSGTNSWIYLSKSPDMSGLNKGWSFPRCFASKFNSKGKAKHRSNGI